MKKHYDAEKFRTAVAALMVQDADLLRAKYRDHALKGNWRDFREIHVEGDWLIIYRVNKSELELVLTRTGSHDALFR